MIISLHQCKVTDNPSCLTVLADALVAAVEAPNTPRLVVDFATLTGRYVGSHSSV